MTIAFMDYMIALRASGLSGPVRSVALWIASRCSNGWSVSLDLIASDSGYSRSTVKRAIDDLEAMGWLTREPDKVKGNSYELLIPFGSKVQGEPTIGSGRTYEKVQSEPTTGNGRFTESLQKVQGEPTVGSGRTYEKVQSEPTYIRTKQEHKNNKNLACAREEDAATIKHSNLNEGLLARWVRELVKVPEAKEEILKLSFQKSPGEVYQAMFVTSLYTSEALFERFRPWFVRLQSEGRL
jgi:hypothetical protein